MATCIAFDDQPEVNECLLEAFGTFYALHQLQVILEDDEMNYSSNLPFLRPMISLWSFYPWAKCKDYPTAYWKQEINNNL